MACCTPWYTTHINPGLDPSVGGFKIPVPGKLQNKIPIAIGINKSGSYFFLIPMYNNTHAIKIMINCLGSEKRPANPLDPRILDKIPKNDISIVSPLL